MHTVRTFLNDHERITHATSLAVMLGRSVNSVRHVAVPGQHMDRMSRLELRYEIGILAVPESGRVLQRSYARIRLLERASCLGPTPNAPTTALCGNHLSPRGDSVCWPASSVRMAWAVVLSLGARPLERKCSLVDGRPSNAPYQRHRLRRGLRRRLRGRHRQIPQDPPSHRRDDGRPQRRPHMGLLRGLGVGRPQPDADRRRCDRWHRLWMDGEARATVARTSSHIT